MPIQTIATIKNWFLTGLKPTQAQFHDWIDSFRHRSEAIQIDDVDALQASLDDKATVAQLNALKAINYSVTGATASMNIPAGTILHKVRVKSNAAQTYRLGTSAGGSQLIPPEQASANQVSISTLDLDCESITTIHFSGLSGTNNIKLYLLQ